MYYFTPFIYIYCVSLHHKNKITQCFTIKTQNKMKKKMEKFAEMIFSEKAEAIALGLFGACIFSGVLYALYSVIVTIL